MFKAIIWDCDGCLIDSEHIACGIAAQLLGEAGYTISTQDFIYRFCGQGKNHIYASIEKDSGINYQPIMESPENLSKQKQAFRQNLMPIKDVHKTLSLIGLPMAVASGSDRDRLEYTLRLTDLYNRFEGYIFDSAIVKKGKPAPDIFLYAADKLNVMPRDCLVIEDSHNGVRAGKAAGMTVFGFTGGSHILDKQQHKIELTDLGADFVFEDMINLPIFINSYTHPAGLNEYAKKLG